MTLSGARLGFAKLPEGEAATNSRKLDLGQTQTHSNLLMLLLLLLRMYIRDPAHTPQEAVYEYIWVLLLVLS